VIGSFDDSESILSGSPRRCQCSRGETSTRHPAGTSLYG
jgi:hypothetical protein